MRLTVSSAELADHLLSLLRTATAGTSITVLDAGRPIATIYPVGDSLCGSWAGKARITGDIVNYNSADDWEVLNDEKGRPEA